MLFNLLFYKFFGPKLKFQSKMAITPNGNIITTECKYDAENIYIFNSKGECIRILRAGKRITAIATLYNGDIVVATHNPYSELRLFTEKGDLIKIVKQSSTVNAIANLPNSHVAICQKEVKACTVLKDSRVITLDRALNTSSLINIFNAQAKKIKSYALPEKVWLKTITALSNGLVVAGGFVSWRTASTNPTKLYVFDPNKGKVIKQCKLTVYIRGLATLKGDSILIGSDENMFIFNPNSGQITAKITNNIANVIKFFKSNETLDKPELNTPLSTGNRPTVVFR